jgi:hypothetical protein
LSAAVAARKSSVRRLVALAVAAILLLAGCGSSSTRSVHDVEKAFLDESVPFQHEQTPNTYIATPAGDRIAAKHVRAVLSPVNNMKFTALFAYVFDSQKAARNAFAAWKALRTRSNHPVIRTRVANVVVIGVPTDAGTGRRVRDAIARLGRG